MKRIGVFTSGGDAPGMNACLRAVVRYAHAKGVEVAGIRRGYQGLLDDDLVPMDQKSVSNIIQRGGTILKTARCAAFLQPEGRAKAAETLRSHSIDGLVAIGGDGTFRGAHALYLEHGTPIIGPPGTIDADLYGTDGAIGFYTAVATAVDAIDKLRDTAESHEQLFFVEVMGRHAGFIALATGVAGGVEAVMLPETPTSLEDLSQELLKGRARGKSSTIVVVSEGDEAGGAFQTAQRVKDLTGLDYRVCILGHIQRGGTPVPADRILASRLGAAAVDALLGGECDKMVGELGGQIALTPFEETYSKKKPVDPSLVELVKILGS